MIRNVLCAGVFLLACVGFVAGEEFFGSIRKVDGNKVTVQKFKKGEGGKKGEPGDEVTLSVAENVKVMTSKGKDEAPTALEGGLTNERFKTIGDRGVMARITTDDAGKVTEIRTFQFGRKKKDNN